MSEITTGLRNRFKQIDRKSTEEVLIEKLDLFLSSIESRLDQFEQYFKFNDLQELEQKKDQHDSSEQQEQQQQPDDGKLLSPKGHIRRRSSNASMHSFKNFARLDLVHQQLKFIKKSVLKSSVLNLEYLYKMLDDQYNYLFNSGEVFNSSDISIDNSKEILSEKIITTILYFDDKLGHIDAMIQSRMSPMERDDSIYNIFKYYNFNKALKLAEKNELHYFQLPLGWRENRYIVHGYRFSLQHKEMIKSIFKFNHNESMNIWTHVLGIFIMFYLGIFHYPNTEVFKVNTNMDHTIVYFFLACAVFCLVSSSIWHTYSCFAKLPLRYRFACVDYTGITVLITASIIAVEYISLFHYPKLFKFFISFSIIAGISGLGFNWSPYFDKPECRSIRIGYFVGLACLGAGTMVFSSYYEGILNTLKFFGPLSYKSFVWYWVGVIFYGGLIPERWRYDVIINEDDNCEHEHNTHDVLSANMEKSGDEEIEEIGNDLNKEIFSDNESIGEEEADDKLKSIIDKHFPEKLVETRYKNDFFSLWWVDYVCSSHSLWHIFVVLGVLGHYSSVLEMFTKTKGLV